MDHPPSGSSGQPALTPADPPAGTGTPVEPRLAEAEVLYTDRQWHPATVEDRRYRIHVR